MNVSLAPQLEGLMSVVSRLLIWLVLGVIVGSLGVRAVPNQKDREKEKPHLVVELGHRGVHSARFSPNGKYVLTTDLDTTVLWDIESSREIRRFEGTLGAESRVFSVDGKYIVTTYKTTVRQWDVERGKEIRQFEADTYQLHSAQFSQDGNYVLAIDDNIVKIWDAESGKELRRFEGNPAIFSPDGKHLLTVTEDKTARLWDVKSGKEIRRLEGHSGSMGWATFSPTGKYVLTVDDAALRLWEVESGVQIRSFEGQFECHSAAFLPDGKLLMSDTSGTRVWDIESGKEVRSFEEAFCGTFSPNGKYVLTVGEAGVAGMWDLESGKQIRQFGEPPAGDYGVSSAVFSADGKCVLTARHDTGTAQLWDVESGEEIKRFEGHASQAHSANFSPDGNHLLVSVDYVACLWNIKSGKEVRRFEGQSSTVYSSVFSTDGKYVLTVSSGAPRLWDIQTGSEIKRFKRPGYVNSAVFSPDGKHVLTASYAWGGSARQNAPRLWDVESAMEVRRFEGHSAPVNSAVFSAHGKWVLTASGRLGYDLGRDNTARLWDVENGNEVRRFEGHADDVNFATFSPDSKYVLTASQDRTARLWDVASGKELRRFEGHLDNVNSATFSPDGKYVLTASQDNTARLWDAGSGKEIRRFQGHSGNVSSATFSPDGKYVLTGSADKESMWRGRNARGDGTARLWSTAAGEELCRIVSFRDGDWAVVSPDGLFDASNLEAIKGLNWVLPDDPMTPLPLEIFPRDYYEPRLLSRLLRGERLKPRRTLSELNRVQPHVRITSIEPRRNEPDLITVTVEVAKAKSERQRDQKGNLRESGVYDLRLFLDGRIVGQYSDRTGRLLPRSERDTERLLTWRKENEIKLDRSGKRPIKFENVKLTRTADLKQVEFSAYAFNEDRIRSKTSRKTFDIAATVLHRKSSRVLSSKRGAAAGQ
jgi:WD40 repeat protein